MRSSPGATESPGAGAESGSLPNRKLRALAEIGGIVVSGEDFEQVLAEVIEKVAHLLNARGGGVMLYDAEAGTLVTQEPAFGISPELVREYRVSLSDGGNAASVFVTGKPYITNDARHDPRVIRRFAVRHAITRLLTVPLRLEGQPIGVFHAIDKLDGDFDADDLELMTSIAPQLAVIVHSAMVMREARRNQQQLERMLQVQDEFTEMLLRGEGTDSLLGRLAQLIELPVLLLDPKGTVTARSREADALAAREQELERLVEATEGQHVAQLELDPETTMTAVRVQVHSDTLGILVAAQPADNGSVATERVLEQAAVLFALDIVRTREVDAIRSRLEGDIVDHLLEAGDGEEAEDLLRRLGVPRADGYRCAVLELGEDGRDSLLSADFQVALARLQRELRLWLAQESVAGVVVERSGALWLALPVGDGDPAAEDEALRRAVGGLRGSAGSVSSGFVVGVGSRVVDALAFAESAEQAQVAVSIGWRMGRANPVVFFDELGVYRLLAQPVGGVEMRQYVDSVLGPVLEYDREHNADWMAFLTTLVQTNFRVTGAAALAGCHINTAKYRLGRLESLLDRDFQSAEDRFAIQLALEIRSLGETLDA